MYEPSGFPLQVLQAAVALHESTGSDFDDSDVLDKMGLSEDSADDVRSILVDLGADWLTIKPLKEPDGKVTRVKVYGVDRVP